MGNTTFQTFQAKGNREDLTDIIRNISPEETWFTSNTADVNATAVYHEWQTDALRSPTANAVVEGADVDNAAITPTTRIGNYLQNVRREFKISDLQEMVAKAGRRSEEAYQTTKCLKEIANDIEYALIINSAAASGASGTARQMLGVIGALTSNVTTGSGTSGITGAASAIEVLYNDNLQAIWAAGGKPKTTLCGAAAKRKISAFTGNNTRHNVMTDGEITAAVDVYNSDFGPMAIRLHYILNGAASGTILNFGDMQHFRKAWMMRPKKEETARAGSARTFFIEGALTLEYGAEKSAGKIVLT